MVAFTLDSLFMDPYLQFDTRVLSSNQFGYIIGVYFTDLRTRELVTVTAYL